MVSRSAYALVLGVALAASVTSLRNGFVYDDVPVVVEDRRIHSLARPSELLVSPYWAETMQDRLYRPATTVSLALDWALGRGNAFLFHATNVALHLLVVALVLTLAAPVLGGAAAVAGLWFAVHPIHVEAYANVVGRSELLSAAAYLVAFLAYSAEGAGARDAPRSARRALLAVTVLLSAALAYAAKEHALTLPAALLLADAWLARASGEPLPRVFGRHALLWTGVSVLALGYLAARGHVLGTTFGGGSIASGLEDLEAWERLVAMLPAFVVWLRLLVWPLHLSADYAPNVFVPGAALGWAHVAGATLVALTLVAAWVARRRAPALSFGVAWFWVTAAVSTNVLFPTGVLIGERLLYLPTVGVAIAVGALWRPVANRKLAWPVVAALLVLLGARTLERIPVWRSPDTFLAARYRDAPESYRTYWERGSKAFDRGDLRTGERELLAAVRIYSHDPALLQELGFRYLGAGVFDAADRFSTASFALDSLRSTAVVQALLARTRAGRIDSAASLAEVAVSRFTDDPTVLIAATLVYYAQGRPLRALALARRMTYLHPRTWQYHQIAAYAAARSGRCAEARQRVARAVALAPGERGPRELVELLGSGPTCAVPDL